VAEAFGGDHPISAAYIPGGHGKRRNMIEDIFDER
jgi:hypothetical protein